MVWSHHHPAALAIIPQQDTIHQRGEPIQRNLDKSRLKNRVDLAGAEIVAPPALNPPLDGDDSMGDNPHRVSQTWSQGPNGGRPPRTSPRRNS
eukprot:1847464-Lingulodinium_polyedra.AAC.1